MIKQSIELTRQELLSLCAACKVLETESEPFPTERIHFAALHKKLKAELIQLERRIIAARSKVVPLASISTTKMPRA